jgi:hypothetical protein
MDYAASFEQTTAGKINLNDVAIKTREIYSVAVRVYV